METAEIAARLAAVRAEIAASAAAAGRQAEEIELVAVSKTHPAAAIEAAIAAGQRVFGENRVQEAQQKFPALKAEHDGLRLHLIGPLQTNKVRAAMELFDVIQTVDRPRLAEAIAAERERRGTCPELYVQVNTGEEPQKAGVLPRDADGLIALCRDRLELPVRGLMCIPPVADEPSPHFALLREIARRNGLDGLSMGMSADFAIAVRLGATVVRVGSAIFGERKLTPAPR